MASSPKVPTLKSCSGEREILEAVAQHAWSARNGDLANFPDDAIPSAMDLARWARTGAGRVAVEANRLLNSVLEGGSSTWMMLTPYCDAVESEGDLLCAVQRVTTLSGDGGSAELFIGSPLAQVHDLWVVQRDPLPHPLLPLVDAWQCRPRKAREFRPIARASLPRLHLITAPEVSHLPNFPVPMERTPHLPEFPGDVGCCPSWLLSLFARKRGQDDRSGPAAYDLRLFLGVLLHLCIHDRDGLTRVLAFPTDYVVSWLHPEGWANYRRDWERFPQALERVASLSRLYVRGFGDFGLVWASGIPRHWTDSVVEFHARVPRVSAPGARLHWPTLCRYGALSSRLYRAYLAVSAFLDRAAHAGHPITREIAPVLLDENGKPLVANGRVVRSLTERVPNRLARFVPFLSDAEVARLVGCDPSDRRRRHEARRAIETLESDGVIEIVRARGGVYLFGPPVPTSSAPAQEDHPRVSSADTSS